MPRCSVLAILTVLSISVLQISSARAQTWHLIDPASISGTPDFSDLHFVDDTTGWISCSSAGNIFKTVDGGLTFTTQTTTYATEAIHMIDDSIGYCGGTNGHVYRTSDGGQNWPAIGSIHVTLAELDFVSESQGYACGDAGAVFSITPGGVTNLNSGLASHLSGISSPSIDNVWVCGGAVISYYDGATYEFQSGYAGTYNSICFINNQEGWVVGNVGRVGQTVDGGETWFTKPGSREPPIRHSTRFMTFSS